MVWKIIVIIVVSLLLIGNVSSAGERGPLVRLLIKKGIITEEEVRELEADISEEETNGKLFTPQLKEISGQKYEGKYSDKGNSSNEKEIKILKNELWSLQEEISKVRSGNNLLAEKMKSGIGGLKIGGLLQLWYTHDEAFGNEAGKADSFRLRRAEIMFSGKMLPEVEWVLMVDTSKDLGFNAGAISQDTRILQDFFFDLGYIPYHNLRVGQFKLPLTEEGLRSSVELDTIERSYIGRTFGDQRDIGIQLSGSWEYVDYDIGIFNGSGQNQLDVNDYMDVSGRIVLKPFKDFEIGISALTGNTGAEIPDRNRLGGEVRYEFNDVTFKGEYMKAKDAKLEREGWYAQVGYIIPFMPQLQSVFKYEEFENSNNIEQRDFTIGLNYFIKRNNVKLQINYVHKNESKDERDNDQVLTALQIAF